VSRRLAEGYQLDSVMVTAASGAACAVPIVWELGSGSGVVWFQAMYLALGIRHPSYSWAREQIRQRETRLCTAAERRLLLTLPGLKIYSWKTFHILVASIDAACQWLRHVGQLQAAEQLSQHQRPVAMAANGDEGQQGLDSLTPAAEGGAHVDAANTLPSEHVTPDPDPEAVQVETPQCASRPHAQASSECSCASVSLPHKRVRHTIAAMMSSAATSTMHIF